MKNYVSIFVALIVLHFASCTADSEAGSESISNVGSYTTMLSFGNRLYAVSKQALLTYDVSNRKSPVLLKKIILGENIESLFRHDSLLLIGSARNMYIYSLGIDGIPAHSSTSDYNDIFEFSCDSSDPIVVVDNYAYVTISSLELDCNQVEINTLLVYDISNVKTPVFKQRVSLSSPKGLGYSKGYLFVCDAKQGVVVFDIENRENPKEVTKIDMTNAFDVIFKNNIMMVVTDKELRQFDITDINNIIELGKILLKK